MTRTTPVAVLLAILALSMLMLNLFAAPQEPAQEDEAAGLPYITEKGCKKCHLDRHESWSKDKHSQSFEYLAEKHRTNEKCLLCHTTGFGEEGFVSVEKTPNLAAVQCEQCHGAGREHMLLMRKLKSDKVPESEYPEEKKINKRPAGCIKCHSPHQEHIPID